MQDALLSAFAKGFGRRSNLLGSARTLTARLDECLNSAAERWPRFNVDREAFAAWIGRAVSRQEGRPARAISLLHAADSYLACACAMRRRAALRAFDAVHLLGIGRIATLRCAPPSAIERVRRALRRQLFVGRSPKIASYSGFGPLAAWVALVAHRTAAELVGREITYDGSDVDTVMDAMLAAGDDPEIDYLKSRYRAELVEGLRVGQEKLSHRDRLVFRLSLAEGFSRERIAAMYHVEPATVSRWLEAARSVVGQEIGRVVADRFPLAPAEFVSLLRVVPRSLDGGVTEAFDDDAKIALA